VDVFCFVRYEHIDDSVLLVHIPDNVLRANLLSKIFTKKSLTNHLSVKVLLILRQFHGRSTVSDQQFMAVLQLLS